MPHPENECQQVLSSPLNMHKHTVAVKCSDTPSNSTFSFICITQKTLCYKVIMDCCFSLTSSWHNLNYYTAQLCQELLFYFYLYLIQMLLL